MCGSPKTPEVVKPVDPQVAADRAASEAAALANAESSARSKSRRKSALATGADGGSALSTGKTTLGQ